MQLSAEVIKGNYDMLVRGIYKYVQGERKQQFIDFYNKFDERIALLPASHKTAYHNCFPGGYADHVLRVIKAAFKVHKVWVEMGMVETYTDEELFVAALNHDLGKIGSSEETSVYPSTDEWRKKNLGEMYSFNTAIGYMTVPDRSLFLLQEAGIQLTTNEWIAIKTHDGLYDKANEAYLKGFMNETKPRTSLPFVLHQADLMAARVEWERDWLHTFSKPETKQKITKQDRVNTNLGKAGEGNTGLMDLVKGL
jgi:hypothetical protein